MRSIRGLLKGINRDSLPKSTLDVFGQAQTGFLSVEGPLHRPFRPTRHVQVSEGGLSKGPKTAAGIEAIRRGRMKHGYYSKAAMLERRRGRVELRVLRQTLVYLNKLSDWPLEEAAAGP